MIDFYDFSICGLHRLPRRKRNINVHRRGIKVRRAVLPAHRLHKEAAAFPAGACLRICVVDHPVLASVGGYGERTVSGAKSALCFLKDGPRVLFPGSWVKGIAACEGKHTETVFIGPASRCGVDQKIFAVSGYMDDFSAL